MKINKEKISCYSKITTAMCKEVNKEKISGYSKIATAMCKEAVNTENVSGYS